VNTFGSLYAEPVRNGLTRPTAVRGEGYRMVNMGELFAYDHIADQPMERVQLNHRELQVATLEQGDLLFARSSLTPEGVGKCSIVASLPEVTTFESHLIRARLDRSRADSRFYFYFFHSYYGKAAVQSIAKQVGAAGLPGSKLAGLMVPRPATAEQTRIADVLAAYDDLIDNNRRRIKLLEDAVRLLFDEWFVRLRFPGALTNLSPDELPPEWRREPLGKLTSKLGSGATPRGGEASYIEDGIALIRSQNVYDYEFFDDGLAFIDQDQAARLDGVTVEAHDVLLNITGASVGRCCMVPRRLVPARVNQHVMIIRAASGMDPHYLLCAINSDERKRQLLSYAQTGSTREALTKDLMLAFEVVVPDTSTLAAFGQYACDAFSQREVLSTLNIKLRTARDLLLPRLMSGEIEV